MDREDPAIAWLLEGDAAVGYQTWRDLLDVDRPDLQERIAAEGDAAAILERGADGRWGRAYYQPKWTSTHYSLLELRDLGIAPDTDVCVRAVADVVVESKGSDGGIDAGAAWRIAADPTRRGALRAGIRERRTSCIRAGARRTGG